MTSQTARKTGSKSHPSIAYNLATIAVIVLLAAVAVAYLVDELGKSSRAPVPAIDDGSPITQTLSGRELTIPTSWFRYGEQIKDGFTNQIDLRVMFKPEGEAAALPVDVTLVPRSRARTSASLLDGVYLHQFSDVTLTGYPGLVGKPMQATNGFGGESVWYDALSPNPFVAKCIDAVSADRSAQCLRTVYLPSGIAAVYAFDATVLQSWRLFDTEMEQWLTKIGAW